MLNITMFYKNYKIHHNAFLIRSNIIVSGMIVPYNQHKPFSPFLWFKSVKLNNLTSILPSPLAEASHFENQISVEMHENKSNKEVCTLKRLLKYIFYDLVCIINKVKLLFLLLGKVSQTMFDNNREIRWYYRQNYARAAETLKLLFILP